MREQIGDFDSVLPIALKRPLGSEQARFRVHELIFGLSKALRPLLAIQFVQQGLGVERVHLAGTARQKQEHHGFRLGLHVRRFGSERVIARCARGLLLQHGAERQGADSTAGIAEKLAAISRDTGMLRHRSLLHHGR